MNVSEREFECKVNINGVTTDVLFPLKMSVDITLFCKDDFLTLVFLKLQGELIGSVTFSFNDFREINTFKRWYYSSSFSWTLLTLSLLLGSHSFSQMMIVTMAIYKKMIWNSPESCSISKFLKYMTQ